MNARHVWLPLGACICLLGQQAWGTIPYTPVTLPPGAFPATGPTIIDPFKVFGKEYSHDADVDVAPILDPEQVIAWDGIGGVANGVDFSFSRPTFTPDLDVDAIANHADALFRQVRGRGRMPDTAHLIYSHDAEITGVAVSATGGIVPVPVTLPGGGPVILSNGDVIGGAGEISRERAGAFAFDDHAVWATQPRINGMPLPRDIDGLEVWGPEPGLTGDSDKYSLVRDPISGVSVWNAAGTPYISHGMIVGAVTSLLGPLPAVGVIGGEQQQQGEFMIDLDALMVLDRVGSIDTFDYDPTGGPSDSIIFSIRQVFSPATSSYYSTGSELIVLDAPAPIGPPFGFASFLDHGGHLWDKAYALAALEVAGPPGLLPTGVRAVIDIDAIEAIGSLVRSSVPEPSSYALFMLGILVSVGLRRRVA